MFPTAFNGHFKAFGILNFTFLFQLAYSGASNTINQASAIIAIFLAKVAYINTTYTKNVIVCTNFSILFKYHNSFSVFVKRPHQTFFYLVYFYTLLYF